ncbi:T-cell surface glycoprotein CD3 gamma chain [Archocentrus centrarchus]|uniref:T-cell surface glycoprotein CD3 gamma chain n=1 Tax=Archocentrus centrarchus TaxID=63155 RepID=UPI0011E9F6B6|nr:T-cell surface glycoprotein CD3 gamma chain-like [Archocentrus centrarchus]
MKSHSALPTCLLLIWTFAVFVSCKDDPPQILVSELAEGIKLICPTGYWIDQQNITELQLSYSDSNTNEYECIKKPTESTTDSTAADVPESLKIFVKFRTCDNCIELDAASISGMIIGDVVATIVVGVGIYLIASHARTGPVTSTKKSKSSDRQHLVSEGRGTNDHYQPLRMRAGQRDVYDELQRN